MGIRTSYLQFKKSLYWIFSLICLLILWQWLVKIFKIPEYILPSPGQIILIAIKYHQQLIRHSFITILEILIGFILGIITAFIISLGILYSKILKRTIYPLLIFFQVIPKIALAPLFLIWFGYGLLPKILITALISFFPIIINTVKGLNAIDAELIDLTYSLSATKIQILTKIRIPSSLPYLFAGLKIGITLAVVGAVVGEFVGASKGLGYVIMLSNANLETSLVFASIVILSIIGIALFLIINLIESKWSWHRSVDISI